MVVRFIPTVIHGFLDYLVSIAVMVAPFAFGASLTVELCFFALGIVDIVYSAATDYELGLVRLFSMNAHLALDIIFVFVISGFPLLLDMAWGLKTFSYIIAASALILVATTRTCRAV